MTVHMTEFWINGRELIELSRALRLPPYADDGYLVHCALNEAMGESAPSIFSVESARERQTRVLAYSQVPADSLAEISRGFASPLAYNIVDWERTRSKPLPEVFPRGLRFDFQVRVCPIVRLGSAKAGHKKGAEVDVFLSRCWDAGEEVPVDRSDVYREWLRGRFGNEQGVELTALQMESFQLVKLVRRTHGTERKAKTLRRPAVTIAGAIEVVDGGRLLHTLERGIGRHRGFGFGMVKVRRGS